MLSKGETTKIEDMSRYPFTKKAVEYIEKLHITLDDLEATKVVLDRALERINSAVRFVKIKEWDYTKHHRDEIELLSYPIAVFLVSSLNNKYVTKRYALAEAKRSYTYLSKEEIEVIKSVADDFTWHIIIDQKTPQFPFRVYFTNYLRNSIWIKEARWRLVNRILKNGFIYLKKLEMARLLQEEIRQRIENNIRKGEVLIPMQLRPIINGLKKNYDNLIPIESSLLLKTGKTSFKSYPPCIKMLHNDLVSDKNLSHIGRFTLTSFLTNVGWSVKDIIKIFTRSADYDNAKTRYQIEHISGTRGGRKKYSPPKCSTLKTHGLCRNPDNLCITVTRPLQYYKVKRNEDHH